jgi:HK97 family phage portal protein
MAFWNKKTEARDLNKGNIPQIMLSQLPGAISATTALTVNDVWACVRLLSNTAASLPLVPYRRVDGGRERLTGGRLPSLLERPAPATTQSALTAQIMTHLLLHGNAYVGLYRNAADEIFQLGLLAPDRIVPEVKANGRLVYTYYPPQGEKLVLSTDDVVHIRALVSLDGLTGLSVIKQAKAAIGLSDQLAQHATSLMANQAAPMGILKLQQFGDVEAEVAELRTFIEGVHKGPANAGKLGVFSGVLDYMALGLPPGDLQFLEQRRWSTVEIARAFGVPAHLVNADFGESKTYSNTELQAAEFLKFSLSPWLVQIEQSITNSVLCSERQYVEFLADALLRAESKSRAEVYQIGLGENGWLSRAEVRRMENLPPEESAPAPAGPVSTNGSGNPENVVVD